MKLLITTQAVNLDDPVLGFFHRWIEEFSKHCESIVVICLKEGRHDLPANVSVHSLGKSAQGRPATGWERFLLQVRYTTRFYAYIWKFRREYDAVFVHMNPEYVVLGGVPWRLWGKRIVLWYAHRQRSRMLSVAVFFASAVCTSARESISVQSPKIHIVGHGIDVKRFAEHPLKPIDPHAPRIVAVGRITPIKHLEIVIGAVADLRTRGVEATLDLIGSPAVASDMAYEESLHSLIRERAAETYVKFLGSIRNSDMPETYARYDLSVNACPTGGVDKAVLESMAAGVPVLVSNESFREYFGDLSEHLLFRYDDSDDLARAMQVLLARTDLKEIRETLRDMTHRKASVENVVSAIMKFLYAASQ
jgi:glycosyltransferase involved in cell wall biosynthesis